MYQLVFYVPESHLSEVKEALFRTGAGRYRNYDCCSFQVKGEGQFRPTEGSAPFLGSVGQIEAVAEYRVEMVCDGRVVADTVAELIRVHPYEEPAYAVYPILTADDLDSLGSGHR